MFLSILGISWFWFYGAMLVTQFPNLARNVLLGDEHVVTVLLVFFSVGVGIGSLLCERLSGHKVELGLVPFGAIGLTALRHGSRLVRGAPRRREQPIGALDFVRDPEHWRLLADLALVGVFGGFYIVPLYALVQSRSDPAARSRTIAGNNILNALFIVAAAAACDRAVSCSARPFPQLILVTALLNAAVAIYIYTLVPEFLMRFIAWLLIHSVYRLEESGIEHIPERGPGAASSATTCLTSTRW